MISLPFFLSSNIITLHLLQHKTQCSHYSLFSSGASTGSGQYFITLHLGTPPQPLLLVADTGSDLIWVTCSACKNCSTRPQHSAFLARHSSTFAPFHCYNEACKLVPHPSHVPCNHTRHHSTCRYEYSYSDGSTTSGFYGRETTSFNTSLGKEVLFPKLQFGCGFRVTGPSISGPSFNGAQGVMGLGRGPISLSSQLGKKFGRKFSYCLMDYTLAPPPTSYLIIGGRARNDEVLRSKMSYTPLLVNAFSPTFYYIRVKDVFIDDVKLPISPSVWAIDESGNGGTVIDSGTTLTFLPLGAYDGVVAEFKKRVKLPEPSVPITDFDFCFNVSAGRVSSLPRLSFRLAGGSIFSPPPQNYFIDTAMDVKCLALQSVASPVGFSVIGNLMQQGFMFEFDRDRSRLGFTRSGCGIMTP
ncbi:hypothetical protein LIER_19116 [Lithospermum erythrorhizon]|uniref:Peptidase A1 domain-containing protein n=1 Tax=Lithospermum erythrorhizon TaxID=34254 RepID=A0AAV3QKG8_LITER